MSLQAQWTAQHAWILGFCLVAMISYTRFNTPPTSRHSTTWGRYHTFAILYMVLSLVTWIALANTPVFVAYVSRDVARELKLTDEVARALAAPLYAALALTLAITAIKPLKAADEHLRKFLQGAARIPWEARRLSGSLRKRTWLPRMALRDAVTSDLLEAGIRRNAISFADDGTPEAVWTKISALRRHLNNWRGTFSFVSMRAQRARLAAFYDKYRTDVDEIETEYAALRDRAQRLFPLLDELAFPRPLPGTGAPAIDSDLARRASDQLSKAFMGEARRLEERLCDLLSKALLKCGLTEGGRRAELDAMGFVVNVTPSRFFDELLGVYAGISVLYLGVLAYFHRPSVVMLAISIATIYIGSVVCGLYPKRWSWAQPSEQGLPWRAYLLGAAFALVFSELAAVGLALLLTFDIRAAVRMFLEASWPWAIIGGTTAVCVAILVDFGTRLRRWGEALVQGSATAIAAYIVWIIRTQMCGASAECVPPIAGVAAAAFAAGGLIGFMIPTVCRRPEMLRSSYDDWTVETTAARAADGQYRALLRVLPPKAGGAGLPSAPFALPFTESFDSADEALAQAVGHARAWIKKHHAPGTNGN